MASGAATRIFPASTHGDGWGGGSDAPPEPDDGGQEEDPDEEEEARDHGPAPDQPGAAPDDGQDPRGDHVELRVAPDLGLLTKPIARVYDPLLDERVDALAAQ